MTKTTLKNQKGISSIVIIAIVAVVIIAGGVYFVKNKSAKNETELDKIKVEDVGLDFSLSPLPDLGVSSVNMEVPQFPGQNIFSGINVDSDFSYQGDTKLSVPAYELNVQIPSGGTTPSGDNSQKETTPPAGQSPAIDCSMFSSVPSCSLIQGAGYDLCKQCFPNK